MKKMSIQKKVIKRNQDKWENSPYSSLRKLNSIQKSILPRFIRFNII